MTPDFNRAEELAKLMHGFYTKEKEVNLDMEQIRDLALICLSYASEIKSDEERITMSSGCNTQGKPFVHYVWEGNGRKCQWSPKETREHALALLHCANAAESDSSVYKFLQSELKLDSQAAAAVLGDLRNYRSQE